MGVTADVRATDGSAIYDLGLLDAEPGIEWEFLSRGGSELDPEASSRYDAVVLWTPSVTARTVTGAERLLLLARLGVGHERIDVDACTAAGVLLAIARDGVRRPMASSAMAFVLALAHRLFQKDRQVRAGRWDRLDDPGLGLAGRTLGLIGLGNVGREIVLLSEPFDMLPIAHDPYVTEAPPGVELVPLETLMRESDFVVVACPLADETRGLVDAGRIALMKRSAFLVNIARGPIVDQAALTEALRTRRIAGAALDVFEREPIDPDDPLLELENVILAPHAVGLTDELFRRAGQSACRAVLDVMAGRMPGHVVNPQALQHPRLRDRLSPT